MHEGRHPDTNIRIGVACRLFASAERAEADGSYSRLRKRPLEMDSRSNEVVAKEYRIYSKASPAGLASLRGPVTLGSNSSDPSEATAARSLDCIAPAPIRRRSDHRTGTDYG